MAFRSELRRGRRKIGVRLIIALGIIAAFATVLLGPGAGSAPAAVIVTIDQQGANDEPNQKDLTQFTIDTASPAGTLVVSFNHDQTAFSGANTGDGCLLFDTDGDGKINYAVCTTFGGNPATLQTTTIYSCGDTRVDRCTTPITPVPPTNGTSCTVSVTATDPFPTGDAYPMDTTSSCTVVLADVGGAGAVLIDACSYPSQQPNSDPSDCVVTATSNTAVTLRSVTAKRSAKGVTVNWRTASEVDVAGYNVYGLVHGKRVKLNAHVIASKGAGANSYAFSYRTPKGQQTPSRLWLQAINLDGSRQWRAARVIR